MLKTPLISLEFTITFEAINRRRTLLGRELLQQKEPWSARCRVWAPIGGGFQTVHVLKTDRLGGTYWAEVDANNHVDGPRSSPHFNLAPDDIIGIAVMTLAELAMEWGARPARDRPAPAPTATAAPSPATPGTETTCADDRDVVALRERVRGLEESRACSSDIEHLEDKAKKLDSAIATLGLAHSTDMRRVDDIAERVHQLEDAVQRTATNADLERRLRALETTNGLAAELDDAVDHRLSLLEAKVSALVAIRRR